MATASLPKAPEDEPDTRQAAILLLGSGRPDWAGAWVYLLSYVGLIALTRVVVRDPELFAERARFRKDAKTWDKWPSAAFSILGLGMLAVVRTVLEHRTLREELPGYGEYASRVPHRLVPGVW